MPVQQSMDIGLPIETVYNQFTQFEDWPTFMHRVTRVTQEDDCTLSFEAKIWTRKREFTADIETQRPNERIKWSVSQGLNHTGTVTFHELGPKLTRVLVGFDVQPGGMIEKFARGARHIKRAARADLHRFKAFIETAEQETGAWRGVIEDGELVEEHDPSYDEQRQYADIEELTKQQDDDEDKADDEQEDRGRKSRDSGDKRSRQSGSRGRSRSSSGSSRSGGGSGSGRSSGSSRSSASGRSSSGRSSSGRSGSGRSSSGRSGSGRSSRSGSASSGTRTRSSSRSGSQRSRSNGRG
jgi:carbon monoxide dehydrogenase subunit G